MNYWLLLIGQLILAVTLLYFFINHKFGFWSKLGVKGPPPSIFKFGNAFQIFGEVPRKIEVELMHKYGGVYGYFAGLMPVLSVTDHKLIKQILVKDFPSWVNRRSLNVYHEYNNTHQFFAEGAQWKRLRTITGKTFTSGKLRGVQKVMDKCVDKLSAYLEKLSNGNGLLDTKSVIAGFTIDVIATTSFATETNANDSRSGSNPFVKSALNFFELSPLKILCVFSMPRWFNRLLGIKLAVNAESFDFFVKLSEEVLKQRRATGSKHNDLVQLLMDSYALDGELNDDSYETLTADAKESNEIETETKPTHTQAKKSKLTDKEIIAQSVLFFIAGFETTAATISNLIYELTMNQEVQQKLYSEIMDKLDGVMPDTDRFFETVMTEVPYMDAVIKETLRKYPPVVRLERRLVVDDYKLEGIPLKRDQLVEIPTIAVHYNSEYYPEPDRFNPERFMPENKHLLVPYTYLPFGDGPRNCVGMRFAYQEIKLFMAKIIPQFKFTPTPATPSEPQFATFKAILFVKPFQVKVENRG